MGWSYYGGDEFNGTIINKKFYGESMVIKQNIIVMNFMVITRNKVMLRYIATKMVTVNNGLLSIRATREPIKTGLRKYEDDPANTDYSIKMRNPIKPKHGYTKYGWWSGALSSRDAGEWRQLLSTLLSY